MSLVLGLRLWVWGFRRRGRVSGLGFGFWALSAIDKFTRGGWVGSRGSWVSILGLGVWVVKLLSLCGTSVGKWFTLNPKP